MASTFWSEWFWLPEGVTWDDLKSEESDKYQPQVKDLRLVLYLAIFVFLIRKILERFLFTKIGEYFCIRDRVPKKAPKNTICEESYKIRKFPKEDALLQLSKQTDLSVRQIERWFRVRRNQDRPSMMCRFTEAAWRFTFYFSIFMYGLCVLWDKEWFADSTYCWKGYPYHYLSSGIYWYYQIEMSFYWSLLFSQFFDIQRKDFWEMFFHHLATIFLLTFSWSLNFIRVGTLVLVIHDAVDFWLEIAKCAKYAGFQKLCDAGFAIMGIVWFVTRLVIYPFKVLKTSWFECKEIVGIYPSLYVFNAMLLVLLILHVYWFKLIVIVAHRAIFKSHEEITDIRSSTEEEVSEEAEADSNNTASSNHIANHYDGEKASKLLSRNTTSKASVDDCLPTDQSSACNHTDK
ncbi:CERS5_6 [Mytilus edulis]|uniref:CERS5_6 n=1 Tax=Mytilus edulis TaxID=6550 RepID=A0A8S3R086_MYTED|nr:CERS5_6 [Mytilus edulis]